MTFCYYFLMSKEVLIGLATGAATGAVVALTVATGGLAAVAGAGALYSAASITAAYAAVTATGAAVAGGTVGTAALIGGSAAGGVYGAIGSADEDISSLEALQVGVANGAKAGAVVGALFVGKFAGKVAAAGAAVGHGQGIKRDRATERTNYSNAPIKKQASGQSDLWNGGVSASSKPSHEASHLQPDPNDFIVDAVRSNNVALVHTLVEQGASIELVVREAAKTSNFAVLQGIAAETPMDHYFGDIAAASNSEHLVLEALEMVDDVHAATKIGVCRAAAAGNRPVFQLLMNLVADSDKVQVMKCVNRAARGNPEILELLKEMN